MKTIHEILKDYDRKAIIDTYLYDYGGCITGYPDQCKKTVKDIKEDIRRSVNRHIDLLLSVTPDPNPNRVLLAYHVFPDLFSGSDDIAFTLIHLEEEYGEFGPQGHAFELCDTEKIMGFYVSDAYTTRYYLTDLLAYVINETSCFGWEREDMEEKREILVKRAEEVESGKAKLIPYHEVIRKWEEEFGWIPEKRNAEEKEMERQIQQRVMEYDLYCLKREVEECRKQIKNNKDQTSSAPAG